MIVLNPIAFFKLRSGDRMLHGLVMLCSPPKRIYQTSSRPIFVLRTLRMQHTFENLCIRKETKVVLLAHDGVSAFLDEQPG